MIKISKLPRLMMVYIDSKPMASKLESMGSLGVMLSFFVRNESIGIKSKLAIYIFG